MVVGHLVHCDSEVPEVAANVIAGEPNRTVVGAINDRRPGRTIVASREEVAAVGLRAVVAPPADVGAAESIHGPEVHLPGVVGRGSRIEVVAVVVRRRVVRDAVIRSSRGTDAGVLARIRDAVVVSVRQGSRRSSGCGLALRDKLGAVVGDFTRRRVERPVVGVLEGHRTDIGVDLHRQPHIRRLGQCIRCPSVAHVNNRAAAVSLLQLEKSRRLRLEASVVSDVGVRGPAVRIAQVRGGRVLELVRIPARLTRVDQVVHPVHLGDGGSFARLASEQRIGGCVVCLREVRAQWVDAQLDIGLSRDEPALSACVDVDREVARLVATGGVPVRTVRRGRGCEVRIGASSDGGIDRILLIEVPDLANTRTAVVEHSVVAVDRRGGGNDYLR